MSTATLLIEPAAYGIENVTDGDVHGWVSYDANLNRQTVTITNDRAWVSVAMARKRTTAAAWRKAREIHPELPQARNGRFGSCVAETGALADDDFSQLRRWARQYGKGWRARLRRTWDASYATDWMRRARNVLGPSGLAKIKI